MGYLAAVSLVNHVFCDNLLVFIVWVFIGEDVSVIRIEELLRNQDVFPEHCLPFFDLFGEDDCIGG